MDTGNVDLVQYIFYEINITYGIYEAIATLCVPEIWWRGYMKHFDVPEFMKQCLNSSEVERFFIVKWWWNESLPGRHWFSNLLRLNTFKHERSTTRHSDWSGIACKLQRCQWKLLQKLLFLMLSMMEITSSSSGFQFFFWGTMPLNCPRGKYPGTVIYYATIHLLYNAYEKRYSKPWLTPL